MTLWQREKCFVLALAVFLVFVVWRWSGMRLDDLPFFTAASALFPIASLADGGSRRVDGGRVLWRKCDAFFCFGLLFLLYLGLQWWNAGRELCFDAEARSWYYTAPRHPRFPWAFSRPEAAQMLHWFFPAWAIGLFVRSSIVSRRGATLLVRVLLYSAALLAVCGAARHMAGSSRLFWRMPSGAEFFASFPYSNHAAAYFVLLGAMAGGMLFREIFRCDCPPRAAVSWRLATAMCLCLMGANLSLSRAGVILAWLLIAFMVVYGLSRGRKLLRPVGRIRLAASTLAVLTLFYFLVAGLGGSDIGREFVVWRRPMHQFLPFLPTVNLDLSDRPRLWRAAWDVFQENPWYGAGGWGFRYLVSFHLPPELWGYLRDNPGRANVHCDPLQYLVEFGVIGTGLLTAVLGTLVIPLTQQGVSRGAVLTLTCVGLALVLVFSLIDIPFRCPAILWTWTALLAVLPKLTAREAEINDADAPCPRLTINRR